MTEEEKKVIQLDQDRFINDVMVRLAADAPDGKVVSPMIEPLVRIVATAVMKVLIEDYGLGEIVE